MKKCLLLFLVFLTAGFLMPTFAAPSPKSIGVKVGAFVGDSEFGLFGYASPQADVTLEGIGIYDRTTADNTGFFRFDNRFSRQSAREACLTAKDQFGRLSFPTCLPTFPDSSQVEIGPVILSPTLSVNQNTYYVGEKIILSGQTIPNTDVDLSSFLASAPRRSFVKSAHAVTLPQVETRSDSKGNFEIAFTPDDPDYLRVFVQSSFKNEPSPRSTTLSVEVLPLYMLLIRFLSSHFLELLILLQIILLGAYFARRYLHPHVISRSRALEIYPEHSIVLKKTEDARLAHLKKSVLRRSI